MFIKYLIVECAVEKDNGVPYKRHNHTATTTLDEDFIKQPFLKLYAKVKGNTHEIKKPHADESRTRDVERDLFRACPCALNKKK